MGVAVESFPVSESDLFGQWIECGRGASLIVSIDLVNMIDLIHGDLGSILLIHHRIRSTA